MRASGDCPTRCRDARPGDGGDRCSVRAIPAKSGPDRRLPRVRRVTKSSDFRRIYADGSRCTGRLAIMWVARSDAGVPRLGVVASKKSLRKAVQRNRARRLLREAFRLNRCRVAPGRDVVLIARRAIDGATRQDVERDLLGMFAKAVLTAGTAEPR